MKSSLRRSKASRSTLRRIDMIFRRGWQPGLPTQPFYRGSSRSRRAVLEAAGRVV